MKPRAGSLERQTRLANLLWDSSRKKEWGSQINKSRHRRGEVTTDTKNVYRIARKYYKQLHARKLDNLGERDIFLETFNLPKLSQEASENFNREITTNDTEAVIKKFPVNKRPGPDGITGKLYPTFREELTLLLLKLFPRIHLEGKRGINSDGRRLDLG